MINRTHSKGISEAKVADIPGLIKSRIAFENNGHTMQAFTDVDGTYAIYSYYKMVATVTKDGTIWTTKAHVFANHKSMIWSALGLSVQGTATSRPQFTYSRKKVSA